MDGIIQKVINESIDATYLKIAKIAVELSMDDKTKEVNGRVALQNFAMALYKNVRTK